MDQTTRIGVLGESLVASGVAAMLEKSTLLTVVITTDSPAHVRAVLEQHGCDVVIVVSTVAETIPAQSVIVDFRQAAPAIVVVHLALGEESDQLAEVVDAVIPSNISEEELRNEVTRWGRVDADLRPRAASELTPRELDVLALVSAGASNGEIGKRLWVSTATVKRHLANVAMKLGTKNRVQSVREATELGLLTESHLREVSERTRNEHSRPNRKWGVPAAGGAFTVAILAGAAAVVVAVPVVIAATLRVPSVDDAVAEPTPTQAPCVRYVSPTAPPVRYDIPEPTVDLDLPNCLTEADVQGFIAAGHGDPGDVYIPSELDHVNARAELFASCAWKLEWVAAYDVGDAARQQTAVNWLSDPTHWETQQRSGSDGVVYRGDGEYEIVDVHTAEQHLASAAAHGDIDTMRHAVTQWCRINLVVE